MNIQIFRRVRKFEHKDRPGPAIEALTPRLRGPEPKASSEIGAENACFGVHVMLQQWRTQNLSQTAGNHFCSHAQTRYMAGM